MPQRQLLPQFTNLVNNGTATLKLPIGGTFHNILFDFSGSGALTRAMIKEVRVYINGSAFIRAPASVIHRDNLYKGSVEENDLFILDFEEPRSREFADQVSSAIHTFSGVEEFKIEFEIEGATNPKITAHANISPTQFPLGLLPCLIRQSFDAISIGTHQIPYAYGKANHLIKRIHVIPKDPNGVELLPDDVIKTMSLIKNNIPLYQKVSPKQARFYQRHYEGIPQTNFNTYDAVEDNNVSTNLLATNDYPLLLEFETLQPARLEMYISMLANINQI